MQKMIKRGLSVFFAVMMLGMTFSISALAESSPISADTYEDLSSEINSAAIDGTETVINITGDITISTIIEISSGKNITLVGNGGSITTTVGYALKVADGGMLTLKDISISVTTKAGGIYLGGGDAVLENVTLNSDQKNPIFVYSSATSDSSLYIKGTTSINDNGIGSSQTSGGLINLYGYVNRKTAYVYFEGGTLNAQYCPYVIACGGTSANYVDLNYVYINPKADVSITGKLHATPTYTVTQQAGYDISSLKINGTEKALTDGAYTIDTSTDVTSIEIAVSAGSSGSGETKVLTDANFTGPSEDYFTTAGIKVTPSETDLSFTVACDNACVVAKDNGDGTYTRLTGTAVEGGYQFTAVSASDTIVVALKGDANGDGDVDASDAVKIRRTDAGGFTANILDDLGILCCDVNGDGDVDAADATRIQRYDAGGFTTNCTIEW